MGGRITCMLTFSRLYQVSFSDVDIILRNTHKLKTNENFKSVYLAPERTKEQRRLHSGIIKHERTYEKKTILGKQQQQQTNKAGQ